MHYVEIGPFTYFDIKPKIRSWKNENSKLIIGRFCSFANDIDIILGGNHLYKRISQYPLKHFILGDEHKETYTNGDIIIGNDVWICTGVTILSGVTIGDGAILGAKSVISKDVPPYAIVVGNPMQIKGYRFSKEEIEILLEIKWWNWNIDKIKENIDILCSGDIYKLLEIYNA